MTSAKGAAYNWTLTTNHGYKMGKLNLLIYLLHISVYGFLMAEIHYWNFQRKNYLHLVKLI